MPSTTTYRGGWSSSICDLFANSRQRSSCCAIACCGLLLSDRNAHFALNEQRPSWWKRFCWNIGLPAGILVFLNILETFLATDQNVLIWDLSIAGTMLIVIILLLCRAKLERARVRRAVMTKIFEKRAGTTERDDLFVSSADTHLQLHAHDTRMAHEMCSCYPIDVAYFMTTSSQNNTEESGQAMAISHPQDICTCLWKSVRCICCGWLCGCWCQLCGMCAIGQEDREIQQLLDKRQLQVDYVTFQPYSDYYPIIQVLRLENDGSLVRHWHAISLLSYNLVKIFGIILVILTIVAVLELDPKFQIQNLVIVLATFAQAFVILFLCHWQWNRFDLSIDALVKYFSSGFILCTFLAIVYEVLVSWVIESISYLIVFLSISKDLTSSSTPEQIKQAASDFAKEHLGIVGIFVFLNAFVVAALVEEMCKYFGYWMVETPDVLDPDELVMETINDLSLSSSSSSLAIQSPQEPNTVAAACQRKTKLSQGAGITIAMIAVAAGFACSENLLYVFVYAPPGISNEIATLLARSMFPIHPLCAAIQSIGVVRRDVEGNSRWQLGLIMLPAIVLHGAFDFILMFLALVESATKSSTDSTGDGDGASATKTDDATFAEFDQGDSLPLILSVSIVIVGLFYYGCESLNQRRRLEALDATTQADSQNFV